MISNNKNNNILLLINCIHIGLGIGLRTARYDCPQPNTKAYMLINDNFIN